MDNALVVSITKKSFTIYDMPEKMRFNDWRAANGIKITSVSCPEIEYDRIFLRGANRQKDSLTSDAFFEKGRTVEDYEDALIEYCNALDVFFFNKSTLRTNGKEVTLWIG